LIDRNGLLKPAFQQNKKMSYQDLLGDSHLSDSMKIVQGCKWRLNTAHFCGADTQEVVGDIRFSRMESACG
jgi:hypothetical protein